MSQPSASHTRWLSLIRYQARVAEEQAMSPSPLNTLAINGLQDSIEALLFLITEHRKIETTKKSEFDKLFDAVAKDVPEISSHRGPMLALNSARVSFKHHGNDASRSTVERHKDNALRFIREAVTHGLNLDIEAVGVEMLVGDEKAREHLTNAQFRADREEAIKDLRLAFDCIIHDYRSRKVWHSAKSLFKSEPSSRPSELTNPRGDKALRHLVEWIEEIDQRQQLSAMGVDLGRYLHFDAHAPTAHYSSGGEPRFLRLDKMQLPIDADTYDRCYNFVIDTALHLASTDFDLNAEASLGRYRRQSGAKPI